MDRFDDPSPPSAIPWPPLLLGAGLVAGWLLGEATLLPRGAHAVLQPLGIGLVAAALAIDIWAVVTFRRVRTAIRPDRPATSLVTAGPFRFSRNPIYCANVMILLGAAGWSGSWGFALTAPVFAVLVTWLAIRPEERHLERRFGDAWRNYAARVRRWI